MAETGGHLPQQEGERIRPEVLLPELETQKLTLETIPRLMRLFGSYDELLMAEMIAQGMYRVNLADYGGVRSYKSVMFSHTQDHKGIHRIGYDTKNISGEVGYYSGDISLSKNQLIVKNHRWGKTVDEADYRSRISFCEDQIGCVYDIENENTSEVSCFALSQHTDGDLSLEIADQLGHLVDKRLIRMYKTKNGGMRIVTEYFYFPGLPNQKGFTGGVIIGADDRVTHASYPIQLSGGLWQADVDFIRNDEGQITKLTSWVYNPEMHQKSMAPYFVSDFRYNGLDPSLSCDITTQYFSHEDLKPQGWQILQGKFTTPIVEQE